MDIPSLAILVTGILIGACRLLQRKRKVPVNRSTGKPLPHPFELPVVGCLPFIRSPLPYTLSEWAQRFGKIFSCRMGPQQTIVLSDVDLVREAYSKNSFSGRAQLQLFLMGLVPSEPESKGILMSEGEPLKEQRRFLLTTFKDFGIGKTSFQDVISEKSHDLLRSLNEQEGRPVDVRMMLNTAVSDVISIVLFGKDYKHAETDFAKYVDHVANVFTQLGGSAPMNFWIWMRFLPYYNKVYQRLTEGMHFTFNVFRAIIANEKKQNPENHPNNFIAAYLARRAEPQGERFTDHQLVLALGDIFAAGFETTATTLRWALLYMCQYPELQEKLHAEIDKEVGRERLPQLSDRDNLPWTEATLLEVQRVASVAPIAIHRTTEDTELAGFSIPQDTVVIASLYHVHHDPATFPNPDKFQPERFLDASHTRIVRTDSLLPFSTGKRACPGEPLARMELSLFFTTLLQKFRFEFPPGSKADLRPRSGITNDTRPFLLCAQPR